MSSGKSGNKIKQEKKESKKLNLHKLADFDFRLNRETAPRYIPFILYLTLMAIIYIANRHYAERTELKINDHNKELKELRAEYLTIKSELMFKSKQSEVAKLVEPIGLKPLTEPPKKLEIKKAK